MRAARFLAIALVALGAAVQTGAAADQTPTPVVTSGPEAMTNSKSATFAFTDADAVATFECSVDNGTFTACVSPAKYSALADGTHTFAVRAVDPANSQPTSESATWMWTVDTVPPPPPTVQGPANPTNITSATFIFSDSEAGVKYGCRLDASGLPPCANPVTFAGPLADGDHTLRVKATDAAGNDSTVISYTWTVDTKPPPVPTIGAHPAIVTTQSTTFTFTSAGAASFQCHVDTAAFSACASGDSFGPYVNGLHTFYVRAVDAAGNTSAAASTTWTVQASPPAVPTIAAHAAVVATPSTTFTFTSAGATSFQCHVDAAAFSACASGDSFGAFADGPHTFYVRAVDAAGNTSANASIEWTIDTKVPLVVITAKPPSITNQTSAAFAFSSTDANRFECALDSAFAACSNSSPVVYTGLADGAHTFSVRGSRVLTGPEAAYVWTVDTIAPETTITANRTANDGVSFEFTSSEPRSTFLCGLDGGGRAPCESPKTYAGLGNGSHTFEVQAVDAAGNTDATPASRSWAVKALTPAAVDRTPPRKVTRIRSSVAYGVLTLAWARPPDTDFDHVKILMSTNPKSSPHTVVYTGARERYMNKHFKNGLYYRYAVISYDRAGNASRGATLVVPQSVLLRTPREGAVLGAPPVLMWSSAPHASFYNVQLYFAGRKVLSVWPNRATLALAKTWTFQSRRYRLKNGLYHWFVWPAFGGRSSARYGQLLGQGTFRVR